MSDKMLCPICGSDLDHEDGISADTVTTVPTETCPTCGFSAFTTHLNNPTKAAVWRDRYLRNLALHVLTGEKARETLHRFAFTGGKNQNELLQAAWQKSIPPRFKDDPTLPPLTPAEIGKVSSHLYAGLY